MRVMLMMRKVEMLHGENGLGCDGAMVIYIPHATGVFPGPPYPVPHVRRVLSLLRFSAVSVSAVKAYPEPNRTDPEGMLHIMKRARFISACVGIHEH